MYVLGYLLANICLEKRTVSKSIAWKSCELWGIGNISQQISEYIFMPNGGNCVYCPSNIFLQLAQFLKFRNITWIFPSFSRGIINHVVQLDQSSVSENVWWIIRDDISGWRRRMYTARSLAFPRKSMGKNAKQLCMQAWLWAMPQTTVSKSIRRWMKRETVMVSYNILDSQYSQTLT